MCRGNNVPVSTIDELDVGINVSPAASAPCNDRVSDNRHRIVALLQRAIRRNHKSKWNPRLIQKRIRRRYSIECTPLIRRVRIRERGWRDARVGREDNVRRRTAQLKWIRWSRQQVRVEQPKTLLSPHIHLSKLVRQRSYAHLRLRLRRLVYRTLSKSGRIDILRFSLRGSSYRSSKVRGLLRLLLLL